MKKRMYSTTQIKSKKDKMRIKLDNSYSKTGNELALDCLLNFKPATFKDKTKVIPRKQKYKDRF